MKKTILTTILLTASFVVFSQNRKIMMPEKPGEKLFGSYIVYNIEGTVEENYNRVISYITNDYNNPYEVIKAREPIERYIKIKGYTNYLAKRAWVTISAFYTVSFHFKQNKIKATIIDLFYGDGKSTMNVTYKTRVRKDSPKIIEGANRLMLEIGRGILAAKKREHDNW